MPSVTTVYVDPSAQAGGDGSITNPFNSWSLVSWHAGYSYLQKAGTTYNGSVVVGGSGTADAPIQIGSYGNGAAPIVDGTVVFDGTAFISIQGYSIIGGASEGIAIYSSSHNVQVIGNEIHDSVAGIWMGGGASTVGHNVIANNDIFNNSVMGIAIDQVANTGNSETTISGNRIYSNGSHGIELEGNYFNVSDNIVYDNGGEIAGSSGIHIYAGGFQGTPYVDFGSYNTISDNVLYSNHDAVLSDGNGIELDQQTHNNLVSDNLAFNNDGAGVAVLDSWSNSIVGNLLIGNAQDPSDTHGLRADLILLETSAGLTANNTVSQNLSLDLQATEQAILIAGSEMLPSNTVTDNGEDLPLHIATAGEKFDFYFSGSLWWDFGGVSMHPVGWSASSGFGVVLAGDAGVETDFVGLHSEYEIVSSINDAVLQFSGSSSQYNITNNGTGSVTIDDTVDHRDLDHLVANYEGLQFSDKILFVENADNANIARLYSAALDRAPDLAGEFGWEAYYKAFIPNVAKAQGIYVSLAETPFNGLPSLADGFILSPEFQQRYGALNNSGFVNQLYHNVLNRAPDEAGLDGWLNLMDHGTSRAVILVGFAESSENIAKTAADWLLQY
jgi:parallel beta-helix repeat protein